MGPRQPLALRIAGVGMRQPKRVLIVVGIAIAIGAPLGLTAFNALDPYKFEDPGTPSAKANKALKDVTGVRADGTVIALVKAPAQSPQGQERIKQVAVELARVAGIKRVLTPYAPPRPALIAKDGRSAFVVGEVNANASSSDVAPAVEKKFNGRDDVEVG